MTNGKLTGIYGLLSSELGDRSGSVHEKAWVSIFLYGLDKRLDHDDQILESKYCNAFEG